MSAEITLISLRGMSLAVLGRKQSGMEVGRGRRKCGRRDIAVERGRRREEEGGGRGFVLQRLKAFVFLFHL